jgi:hypothetical protein
VRVLSFAPMVLVLVSAGVATAAQDETKPPEASPQQQTDPTPAGKSKVVYVADFEFDVVNANDDTVSPSAEPAPAAALDAKKEQGPAEQASRLVDFVSSTLVKELQNAGYTARRMRPGEARPEEGIRIRGVFAEPDEENRLRRAVIGNGPGVGKMVLFVGISNLAKPDQALYAMADPNGGDKAGPVITLSAYAPVAKFEMPKDVTEKALKDTASSIVSDLTALLNANAAAVTQ